MLDRARLAHILNERAQDLFEEGDGQLLTQARAVFERIKDDPFLAVKIAQIDTALMVPWWQGPLGQSFACQPMRNPYRVIAVDGSQIYPDRHQGTSCSLVNIGTVQLNYGLPGKAVIFASEPYVYAAGDDLLLPLSPELINCRRQELELSTGLRVTSAFNEQDAVPPLFLSDGSFVFWHLDGNEPTVRDHFLNNYLLILHQCYTQQVLMAGYISMPRSKEIVNVLRYAAADFAPVADPTPAFASLVDTQIMSFILQPNMRSTVFKSTANITHHYPDALKPHFFYCASESEIARVEIPAWIAQNPEQVDYIASIIMDQIFKGSGYPVCLAEAHEQAVIKGPDRDFFYHLIQKVGMNSRHYVRMSPKNVKKRGIGI